ncbi:MAG TPA: Z1 domain-containing protein [Thermoanaerobaculia bacterium]|jgi:hypothetical protein|nr:Z1 domain-containing protein [Thermoanaerobaculia bacterium]
MDGRLFSTAVAALKLEGEEAKDTENNARNIVGEIQKAYEGSLSGGRVARPATGLVYGRIQSGKTRAMIASTALAFDNDFKIAVVMTSNINDLVNQTHFDFVAGLPGVMTFTKDNDLEREIDNVKIQLEQGDGRLLIVGSKGKGSLENISRFLKKVHAEDHPTIIFDDEGDQASLDTNTRRRSRSAVAVAPSTINRVIQQQLRVTAPRHVYVSVTGTPQAVLLQSAESSHRPSFIVMLPPGATYVGGDHFFDSDEPEDNARKLIKVVDVMEQQRLLAPGSGIPEGLRRSILFFLVASAAAIKNLGIPEKGYSFLCHPSLKNQEQAVADRKINKFLTSVASALLKGTDPNILKDLEAAYGDLKVTLGAATPPFDDLKTEIARQLATRRILVINAKVKRQGIAYGKGLNFLIGGNTLGRGIAIKDLLVTYYTRDSQISQIDTMHQHARMFGYRSKTLAYTRLFIPRHLYYRFSNIHYSDGELRDFIDKHKAELPNSFPIDFQYDLRTTRPGVLDVNKTDTVHPGKQIFPNHVRLPQDQRLHAKILRMIRDDLGVTTGADENKFERAGKAGTTITTARAIELVKLIKTGSKNTWRDKTIDVVLKKLAQELGDGILLKFRFANRTVGEAGHIETGTLFGPEVNQARGKDKPTLWLMDVTATPQSAIGSGSRFIYPTLVVPTKLETLIMFNKG